MPQGYTIGGARQKIPVGEAREDQPRASQIVHQVRLELEEVLQLLETR